MVNREAELWRGACGGVGAGGVKIAVATRPMPRSHEAFLDDSRLTRMSGK